MQFKLCKSNKKKCVTTKEMRFACNLALNTRLFIVGTPKRLSLEAFLDGCNWNVIGDHSTNHAWQCISLYHSLLLALNIFLLIAEKNLEKISYCILQFDAKTALQRHVSCILLVTCRCDTAGSGASFVSSQTPLAVDTNIVGNSWNTYHLT